MEMIKIYKGTLVDARELHGFLGSKQEFSTWIKSRIRRYQFQENEDFFTIDKIVKRENAKRQGASKSKEYHLTLDTAKELAMVENNDKGREARRYFIEAEKRLRSPENKRLEAFTKLETSKSKLLGIVKDFGGSDDDYIQIDLNGRKVLFNGKPIEDENLSTLLLMGRGFATEVTNAKAISSNLSLDEINDINELNHGDVREIIINNTGKSPEELPPEESIKKLKTDTDEDKLRE